MDRPMRLRELGLSVGELPVGPTNSIVDVPGVRVGHRSVHGPGPAGTAKPVHTGVTVVLPGGGQGLLRTPLPAAVDVFNGYGKSAGLMQVAQRGEIETPLYLTGTLNMGRVWDAAVTLALEGRPGLVTVNPVVLECNDAGLNDAAGRHVGEGQVRQAVRSAGAQPPELGSVGAGSGMRCLGRKGGVGSSSRVVKTGALGNVTLGVLSLNNFGGRPTWRGRELPPPAASPAVGKSRSPAEHPGAPPNRPGAGPRAESSDGSVIVVIALGAALAPILLGRIARRAWAGIARVGSNFGDASGDIALAFALPSPEGDCPQEPRWRLPGEDLNSLMSACAEATEESVWDCLLAAGDHLGPDGKLIAGLRGEELLEAGE